MLKAFFAALLTNSILWRTGVGGLPGHLADSPFLAPE